MTKFKKKWWMQDKDKVHTFVMEEMNSLDKEYHTQRLSQLMSYRHYANKYYQAALRGNYISQTISKQAGSNQNPMVINIIRNIVDTITGKITKGNTKVVVLPKKNDIMAEKKATSLEKWLSSEFKEKKVQEHLRDAFRHCAITGNGFLKIFFDPHKGENGEICVEPMLPTELFFPPDISLYGQPTSCFQIKAVDKYKLAALYPKYESQILSANMLDAKKHGKRLSYHDENEIITVYEAWRLKGPDEPQGRHCIVIDGVTLLDESYPYEDFPFVSLFYNKPPLGYWSVGVADLIRSIQIEINMLLVMISENQRLMSRPKWFVPKGAQIPPNMFTNRVDIVEYNASQTGGPPTMAVANSTPAEIYQHLDRLIETAYQVVGVSQMAATSQKDPALRSGVAIQSAMDIESERFIELQQMYENAKKDIALRFLDLAKKHYLPEDQRVLKAIEKDSFEEIAWNDLDIDDSNYAIDVQTGSSMPDTKAGKMQFVLDLVQLGLIQDQTQLLELLEFPSQEKVFETMLGDQKLAEEYILQLTDEEAEYVSPDAVENHAVILQKITAFYKSRRFSSLSEEVREKIRRHMEERILLIQAQAPVQLPPQGTPPGTA